MRGQRARAAVKDRLGVVPPELADKIERIGDNPQDWLAVALDLMPVDAPNVSRPAAMAVAAMTRFALAETSLDHPLREHFVRYYGASSGLLADEYDDIAALDEADAVLSAEIEHRRDDDLIRLIVIYGQARTAGVRVRLSPGAGSTQALVDAQRKLLSVMPADEPGTAELMTDLAAAFHDLFHLTGEPHAVTESVRWSRQALNRAGHDHPRLDYLLQTAATALKHQYQVLGDEPALTEAVRLSRHGVRRQAAEGQEDWPAVAELARLLWWEYQAHGDPDSLDESIDSYEACVPFLENAGPATGPVWTGLGNALRMRYQVLGRPADLDGAVRAMRQAVAVTPGGAPEMVTFLANLSAILYMWYDHTQDEDVHAEAIAVGRTALLCDDSGEDGRRALSNLGSNLITRHGRTGDSRAVEDAVALLTKAVTDTPPQDPELAARLNNLAEALFAQFMRSGDIETLNRAIHLGRQASAEAAGAPGRFGFLTQLGVRLRRRHHITGNLADLTEAMAVTREAVTTMPTTDPDRPMFLAKFVMTIRDLYDKTKRPELLAEAIEAARTTLRDLSEGHPARASVATALAGALNSSYRDTGDVAAAREAIELLAGASLADGPPSERIAQARLAAGMSVQIAEWQQAADSLAHAIGLVPMTASRRLTRADQEHQLSALAGIVQDACACALQVGAADQAATLLEQGRGILFGQALDDRDGLGELPALHPGLADQLNQVRDSLASTVDADEQHKQARRWDKLIAEVRGLTGFERFLLPASVEDLTASAAHGPVVLLSTSDIRSDALILADGQVDVVRLPDASPNAVRERARDLLAAIDAGGDRNSQRQMAVTLEWLWEAVTGPVLDHLDISRAPGAGDEWTRLWWCPSGPLSFLPLHASGAVIDRVISSYTPTVRALTHARRRRRDPQQHRALVVTMSRTEEVADLPGASAEAEILRARLDHLTELDEQTADHDRVLAEMPGHAWAHFACHGLSHPENPSASHLLLRDHTTRPMTVLDISRLQMEDAELAYLSACSTARVAPTLTDEAIHLASAFQLVGYRHVIATLWPINDRLAVQFVEEVYDHLVKWTASSAAEAVHLATQRIRDRWRDYPQLWAGHVHMGA